MGSDRPQQLRDERVNLIGIAFRYAQPALRTFVANPHHDANADVVASVPSTAYSFRSVLVTG